MITFSYQARDASGRIVSGIQDALNEDNAVTSLMSRGLMVLSLQKKAIASRSRKKVRSVKETDVVLFTRQLATMIEAGISLVQALTARSGQCDPNGMVFPCCRNRRCDLRSAGVPSFQTRQATFRSVALETAGLRSAGFENLHVAVRPHLCPTDSQWCPDSRSARHRRRHVWKS